MINIRESDIHNLYTEIQAGRTFGMVTMDPALLAIYQTGDITYDKACSMARDPKTIRDRVV